ncbi:MAG: IS21-like element helper ATPase IstB, partial [Candidatus Limnocylindrales bacterium]
TLVKEAHFRLAAVPEDLDFQTPRGLDRGGLRQLAQGGWIARHHNVVISGPTGVGKTFVACALGHAACRQGYRVRYFRIPRLLQELAEAKVTQAYRATLQRLARIEVLVLDDWGLAALSPDESRDFLECVDDRYQVHSTIMVSQVPVDQWAGLLPDPTVGEALLDRLVHNAHALTLRGESMRKLQAGGPSAPPLGAGVSADDRRPQ